MLETPPPAALTPTSTAALAGPIPLYVEPLPLPVRHTVRVTVVPEGALTLDTVQSVEVEVVVEGGARGDRTVHAVFVTPSGLAWERQGTIIATTPGEPAVARFTLPVAATFISDQRLSGTWQITTLDEGVEQAGASFALEE